MKETAVPDVKPLLNFYTTQVANRPAVYSHAEKLFDPEALFSVAKLKQCLNNPLLTKDWLSLRKNDKQVNLDSAMLFKIVQRYELQFLNKEVIEKHINQGGAVVLEGIDIMDAGINAFVARLDDALPCALSNCVAFFSQQEKEAYGGHRDADDVLVVQISGEKTWQVFEPQQRRYAGNAPLNRKQLGRLHKELTMRPGDALFVRAGVPHLCRTPKSHSLHLAFDLADRTTTVEQITAEANNRYNQATEDAHAPAENVIDRYVSLLQSPQFRQNVKSATQHIRTEAREFRRMIGRSSGIEGLDKYID